MTCAFMATTSAPTNAAGYATDGESRPDLLRLKAPTALLQVTLHSLPPNAIPGPAMKKTDRARMLALFVFLSGVLWTVKQSLDNLFTTSHVAYLVGGGSPDRCRVR
jgi:hypothetical protein